MLPEMIDFLGIYGKSQDSVWASLADISIQIIAATVDPNNKVTYSSRPKTKPSLLGKLNSSKQEA